MSAEQIPGELLEVVERRRRTGVIFAVPMETLAQNAIALQRQLQERFPQVVVAVAPGVNSIAFEWDEDES